MPKKAKAPKRAKAEKYEALELQQQRKEPRYKEKYKGLAAELGAQKASLQLETEQQHQAQERQKVLVDFIQCQEEITRILQYHDSLLQQTSSPATVDVTASAPAGLIGGNNRFNCLLAAVQVEHIHQVLMLQPEEWMRLATEKFQEQVVLLELADRELSAARSGPLDGDSTTVAALAGSRESLTENTVKTAEQHRNVATAAAVEHAATDYDNGGLGPSALQQLECLVQYGLYMVGLAMLHNATPYYISAACNHLTGQIETAPPQHVQSVLSRLRLSDLQLLHFRIAIEEFERLSRNAQQEGGELSEQIARLSLQQLVDGVTQNEQQEQQTSSVNENVTGTTVTIAINGSRGSKEQECSDPSDASASAAAAAAEVAADSIAADDTMRQQLMAHMHRYLGRMNIHTCVTAWFIANTLTYRQLATMSIASFPFAPNVHAVAEAAKQLHKQQQQERLARIASRVTEEKLFNQEEEPNAACIPPPAAQQQQAQQQQQRMESDARYKAWDKEVADYIASRSTLLQQQLQQWWLDIGALP